MSNQPSNSEMKRVLKNLGIDLVDRGNLKQASDILRIRANHYELMAKRAEIIAQVEQLDIHVAQDKIRLEQMTSVKERLANKSITEEQAGVEMNEIMNPKPVETAEKHIPHSREGEISDSEFDVDIANGIVKRTEEGLGKQEELVNRVVDARKALDLALNTFRKESLNYLDELDGYLLRMRQTRMALDTESKNILSQCADVRKFFLSDDHTEQMKRLVQFAETCRTLKVLKESGFLDAITDTILKLEVK